MKARLLVLASVFGALSVPVLGVEIYTFSGTFVFQQGSSVEAVVGLNGATFTLSIDVDSNALPLEPCLSVGAACYTVRDSVLNIKGSSVDGTYQLENLTNLLRIINDAPAGDAIQLITSDFQLASGIFIKRLSFVFPGSTWNSTALPTYHSTRATGTQLAGDAQLADGPSNATQAIYTFTNLSASQNTIDVPESSTFVVRNLTENPITIFGSKLSLNNSGQIGTTIRVGNTDDFVIMDFNGNVVNITQGQFGVAGTSSINDLGQAVFLSADNFGLDNGDVIFFDGTNFTNLTNSSFNVFRLDGRALNNNGQIAFGTSSGVIFYDGTQLSNITAGTGLVCCGPVAVNNSGAIAFIAEGADEDAFLFDGTLRNLSTNIARTEGGISINDRGEVLFQANPGIVNGSELFLYDGTSTNNLSTTFGIPGTINTTVLNNNSEIAFVTSACGQCHDLWFLGSGGLELVFSSKANIGGGGFDMNDNGEIVMNFGEDIFLVTRQDVEPVTLDIQPHSDSNSINCNNDKKAITVAILTTEDFDATTVDHTTVTFEGASETHVNKKSGEPKRHEKDVDHDGDTDLEFHFRLGETELTCESTEGTLTGETFGGMAIEGTDEINMVGGTTVITVGQPIP